MTTQIKLSRTMVSLVLITLLRFPIFHSAVLISSDPCDSSTYDSWDFSGGYFASARTSNCPGSNDECLAVWGSGYGAKTFDVSDYHDIYLRLDITHRLFEAGDYCQILLTCDGSSFPYSTTIDFYDSVPYENLNVPAPSCADDNAKFAIRIAKSSSGGTSSKNCLWADINIYGTRYTPSPTAKPTPKPTGSPTLTPPTGSPSGSPTTGAPTTASDAPTINPTKTPTLNPTTATEEPTTGSPTTEPTANPTDDPSINPTNDPSVEPTHDPSNDPTIEPTHVPTSAPSLSPSVAPTLSPSLTPTIAPSSTPSAAPSLSPSMTPTGSPLSLEEILAQVSVDDRGSHNVAYALVVFAMLISFFSWLYSKGKCQILRRITGFDDSDDAQWFNVFTFMVQCFDLYSDIIFSFSLSVYNNEIRSTSYAEQQDKSVIKLLFIASVIFIAVPYLMNLLSAVHIITNIQRDNDSSAYTKNFFTRKDKLYTMLVLCCGGAVPALELLNCKIFGIAYLNAGISRFSLRKKYSKYRFFCTVVCENMEQIIIQAVFIIYFHQITDAVVLSMISSSLSVLISFLTFLITQAAPGEFHMISVGISLKKMRSKYNTMNNNNAKAIVYYNSYVEERHLYEENAVIDDNYRKHTISKLKLSWRKKLSSTFDKVFNECAFEFVSSDTVPTQKYDAVISGFYRNLEKKHSLKHLFIFKRKALTSEIEKALNIENAYLRPSYVFVIEIEIMNDMESDSNDIEGESRAEMTKTKSKAAEPQMLLNEWGLNQYWNMFDELGWDDTKLWNKLVILDAEMQKIFGSKTGHKIKFIDNVNTLQLIENSHA